MSHVLTIGYLTGSASVTKNHLHNDEIIWRKRRTVGQMFFQPYESREEFIFCAHNTFLPIVMIGLAVLDPIVIITVPVLIGCSSAVSAVLGEISKFCGNESDASYFLDIAEYLIKDLCQMLINLIVLPLSALAMLTRGVSTGLHATGIVREHEKSPSPSL
jgi:hypothetical protein